MTPRSLQRLAAQVRDELMRAGVLFQEPGHPYQQNAQEGLGGIQEEQEEESPLPTSGDSSGVGTLTMSREPADENGRLSRSRSRSLRDW